MGMSGEFNFRGRNPVKIRYCQHLNNVVEQDHRRVKGRLQTMLGFKTFYNARRVIISIELAQKIYKLQFAIPITLQSNPAVIWRHFMAAEAASPQWTPGLIAPTSLYMHQNSLLGHLSEVVIECRTSLVACECRIRGDRPRRPKTAYACV